MNSKHAASLFLQSPQPSLEHLLITDVLEAIRFSKSPLLSAALTRWLTPPVREIARLARAFDEDVHRVGLNEAARRFLPQMIPLPVFKGGEDLPLQGPLLLLANHPGTIDALLVLSRVPRDDIKLVASDRPFFRALPAFSTYLIFSSRVDRLAKASVVRQAIRHLQSGGVLFLFPAGRLEPDPAREADKALQAINEWSSSIEAILSRAPSTQVQVAMVSNLITPNAMKHPFTKLQKDTYKARITAEVLQLWAQMQFKRIPPLTPQVVFSPVFSLQELQLLHESPWAAIQAIARNLIRLKSAPPFPVISPLTSIP